MSLPSSQSSNALPGLLPNRAHERNACYDAIVREFQPASFTENLLARDAARQAARLLHGERLLDAAEAQAAAAATSLAGDPGSTGALSMASAELYFPERLDLLLRASQRNSRAFHDGVRRLREMRQDRRAESEFICERDSRFLDEAACIGYLARRFYFGHQGCRRCSAIGCGSWIASRKAWECKCGTQTTVRHGTVMVHSRVPLVDWFHAIRVLLFRPSITATELAKTIRVARVATVRGMHTKINSAMLADDATQQLGGLDELYLPVLNYAPLEMIDSYEPGRGVS